jgi:uroporphyrinogen-III synthase
MKIKRILISQPRPELERSPYFDIARNYNIEVDFRPFIQVEGIPAKEFRKNRIDILSYNAVIMTSKNAVDHFFRVCNEMRIIVPETMKYFCISEATAYYLQKYIQFRKRKIFFSNFSFADLVEIIKKKHMAEKFLLPCTDAANEEYTDILDKEGIKYVKAPLYKAAYSNLTDIDFNSYDMLVLFSSAGIVSLLNNFPDFKQHNTMIAAFGEQTAKAVISAGLKLHIHAPQPQAPSMAMALDQFLKGEMKNEPWQQAPFVPQVNQGPRLAPSRMPKVPKPPKVAKTPKAEPVVKKEEKKVVAAKPVAKPAPKAKEVKKAKPAVKAKPVKAKAKPAPKKAKPVKKAKSKPAPKKQVKKTKPKAVKKHAAKKHSAPKKVAKKAKKKKR